MMMTMIITVTVREMTVAKVTRMMRELRVKVKYHYQMKFKQTLESSKRMETIWKWTIKISSFHTGILKH